MSGAVSAVAKVFKKVTKSVVGKIIIGAAAAYFTAGLGATVLGATGIGTVGAGGVLSVAGSEVLGTVLSNALSGVVAGGITSGLTGGNIGKGMLFGGLGGAVMGGVQTMLGNTASVAGYQAPAWVNPDTAGQAISAGTDAATVASAMQNVGPWQNPDLPIGDVPGAQLGNAGPYAPGGQPPPVQEMGNVSVPPGGVATPAPRGLLTGSQTTDPGMFGKGGWVERNQSLAGGAISGLGQGLLTGQAAETQADAYDRRTQAQIEAEREKAARTAASHEGMNLLTPRTNVISTTQRPTPTARFDPKTYGGQWVYDSAQGRVVFVPNA